METMLRSQIDNHQDHTMILAEIKELRIDLKEAITAFTEESSRRDEQLQANIDKLKDQLHEESKDNAQALRDIKLLAGVLKWVGTPVLIVAVSALGKASGLI